MAMRLFRASPAELSIRTTLLFAITYVQVTVGALPYVLEESYVGEDFFTKWNFWSGLDPSDGSVEYVDVAEAMDSNLASATADRVYLGADKTTVVQGNARRSVRIQSIAEYNSGLFVAKIDHIPTGCGTWPAFWLYGEDPEHIWPAKGEYDIIETVHKVERTLTTLHTSPNCDQSMVNTAEVEWDVGTFGNPADNCDISATDQFHNQGCSQMGPPESSGAVFNARNGGTYAAEWDPEYMQIRTWFWPTGEEPPELATHNPDPSTWGAPYSYFQLGSNCPANHFSDMRLVFSLNFCGDLGDAKFGEMCPEYASTLTCTEFVAQHPEMMAQAFWSIRALDVYQRGGASNQVPSGQNPFTIITDQHAPQSRRSQIKEFLLKDGWLQGMCMFLLVASSIATAVALLVRAQFHKMEQGGGLMNNGFPGTAGPVGHGPALRIPSRGPSNTLNSSRTSPRPPMTSPRLPMSEDGTTPRLDSWTSTPRLESWGESNGRDRMNSWHRSERANSWESSGRDRIGSWGGTSSTFGFLDA